MPEYLIDEFIGKVNAEYTLDEQIDKKVSLLYDMCMLVKDEKNPDEREEAVRKLLASYGNEIRIDNAVRDVIVGNHTLNELLKRKGYM